MQIWRAEDVAWRRIDRETVVVHLTRHRMYALNESGGTLWEALATPLDGSRLTELLSDSDATAFLADLAAEGLVEVNEPLPKIPAPVPKGDDPAVPRIEWREEVRRFAGACALLPGGSLLCNATPRFS